MEEDLKQLQEDIDLRNALIADLQQKILDSDRGKTFSANFITHWLIKTSLPCSEAHCFLL
jgi:hypothetical protein